MYCFFDLDSYTLHAFLNLCFAEWHPAISGCHHKSTADSNFESVETETQIHRVSYSYPSFLHNFMLFDHATSHHLLSALSFHITGCSGPTRALFCTVSNTHMDLGRGWTPARTLGTPKTRANISFEHYVSTHCRQVFSHTLVAPFPLFSLWEDAMSDSIHGLPLPVLVSSLRLKTVLPPIPLFCFKSLHSDAAQQPHKFLLPYLLCLLPIWANKGPLWLI